MKTSKYSVKIENEKFGVILQENFVDSTQFKLFLKMIHGCLELKNNLTFFNGLDFLVHIPFKILEESIVITSVQELEFTEMVRSKIEALETKN